ncbi:MAG TPA: hypothetical protein VFC02_25515 [Anaerolineales bacterium]|nr:hypothetical protein [Anaerolineales bacterium]
MYFTKAIAIFIARELASSVVDLLMVVTPRLQTGIIGADLRNLRL